MKARKKSNVGKYTIGPHGEIYNNQPELSERTKNLINALMFQEALEEAFEEEQNNIEEDVNNYGEGTTETNPEELHN
jgi:hypothetical protein